LSCVIKCNDRFQVGSAACDLTYRTHSKAIVYYAHPRFQGEYFAALWRGGLRCGINGLKSLVLAGWDRFDGILPVWRFLHFKLRLPAEIAITPAHHIFLRPIKCLCDF